MGVILYILLSGLPPFNGNNPKEILKAIKSMKYNLDGNWFFMQCQKWAISVCWPKIW